jgi:hypothetical protein
MALSVGYCSAIFWSLLEQQRTLIGTGAEWIGRE